MSSTKKNNEIRLSTITKSYFRMTGNNITKISLKQKQFKISIEKRRKPNVQKLQ